MIREHVYKVPTMVPCTLDVQVNDTSFAVINNNEVRSVRPLS